MTRARFLTTLHAARRRPARGFSLIEVMVASAVFLMIMVAVYTVYMRALESHKLGVNQAELIQSTRFGFEEMATRIRSAGYEFDLDGQPSDSPNQSDESIEYLGERAIIVRANYDFSSEAFRGREVAYENNGGGCCPVVTTANDEILAFALSKDEGAGDPPTETITAYFDLNAPRNGIVSSTSGLVEGEETVTIPNVALTNLDDPPYTLYQFTWSDPGDGQPAELIRRPLVDNILDLRFEYYDEGGTQLTYRDGGPSPSADGDPGAVERADRERVRKVKIYIKGMTPERDLRYEDPDDTNDSTKKHRKFELVQEVHTFNVGRRGLKDRDDKAPEGVSDVQLCSGQCGMVRVDWKPGPPEDRVTDHVVVLASCSGGSSPNWDAPLASFIVVSDLDLTVSPEREYAVFDVEDDADLVAGANVCARVIPRDSSGAEALDPADSNQNTANPDPTPNDYTVIQDYSRSEAPSNGQGSGYDSSDSDWPDAEPDNDGGLAITTAATAESYPLENRIELTFDSPKYVLNRLTAGGAPLYNWTTSSDLDGTYAALQDDVDPGEVCYRIELSPDDSDADYRTPLEETARTANRSRPNVYVFRVSGSDDSNWGPGQSDCDLGGPNCIDEPRSFVPYGGNLHSFFSASLAGGSFSFTDTSGSRFLSDDASTDPYEDRYLFTETHPVTPAGFEAPVKQLTPGEVYYYRVRVVDNCWTDENQDGVEDSTEGTADPLTAWSTVGDFPSEDDWREAAVTISPFYPPLIPDGGGAGDRDVPTDSEDDSDAVDLADLQDVDAYALPGYAIPAFLQGNTYVRPEKPTEFYLARSNDSGSELLPVDGSGQPGVRVLFNSAKRNAPQDTTGGSAVNAEAVGYTWYKLMRKPVTYTPGTPLAAADVDWEANAPTAETIAEFRLSAAGIRDYTIDRRAEVLGGKNSSQANAGLYLSASTHAYKLFTMQVTTGTHHDGVLGGDPLPAHVADDGTTPDGARPSVGSRVFVFPTDFYDLVAEVRVLPNPPSGINAQTIDVEITMDALAAADCADVKSLRLLALDYDSGQALGSSDWFDATAVTCDFTIGRSYITQALRGFPDRARFRVELSDVDETLVANGGADWDKQPRGARVRSDLLGGAGDYELSTTCTADCGSNGTPNILGTVTDQQITTLDGDRVVSIEVDVLPCNTQDFSLLQVEVAFDVTGTLPDFVSADLTGLRTGTLRLPAPEFEGQDGTLWRYRWFEGAFCDAGGVCDFPVIDADSDTIELKLRFAGPVCGDDVLLSSFDYRVLVSNAGSLEELLCSNRGEFAPDAPGGVDEPDHYCLLGGVDSTVDCGRGAAVNPEPCGQNPDCEPACVANQCPVNQDMSIDPDTFLEDDPSEAMGNSRVVRVEQREDCSEDCALSLTEVEARFECDVADRDCSVVPLPQYVSANLIHEDGSEEPLPMPTIDRVAEDHVQLTWTGLAGLEVLPGEVFGIEILFDGTMVDTKLTTWHLQFGAPLASTENCDVANELDIPNSN